MAPRSLPFEELLIDQLRVLGPDAPYILATRGSIALWRGDGTPARVAIVNEDLFPDALSLGEV